MTAPVTPAPAGQRPPERTTPQAPRSYEEDAALLMRTLGTGGGDTPSPVAAPLEESAGPDKPQKTGSVVAGLKSIVTRPGETFKSIGRGIVNTVDDTAETLLTLASRPFKGAAGSEEFAQDATQFIDNTRDAIFGTRPQSASQNFVEDTAQFVSGFFGTGKLKALKSFSKLGRVAQAATRGAVVDFAMFDPHKEQLAELARSTEIPGIHGLGELLSVEGDDGPLVARTKRAVGGVIPGVALDGLIASARLFRNLDILKNPKAAPAAKAAAEEAVETQTKILGDIEAGTHATDQPVQVKPNGDGRWKIEGEGSSGVFETRPEAEGLAASINEALGARFTAKAALDNETAESVLKLARDIEEAAGDPEKIVQLVSEARFNYGYLKAPARTEAILKSLGEHLSPVFDKAQGRPGVPLSESVNRALELAGMLTREDADQYLRSTGQVIQNSDAHLLLLNSRLLEHGESVAKWGRILDERPTDAVAIGEARAALQNYADFAAEVSGANSGQGRGLNALKARGDARLKGVKLKDEPGAKAPKAKSDAPAEPVLDAIAGMDVAELQAITRMFRTASEPKAILRTLDSVIQIDESTGLARVGRGMLEFFYNSVLSGPATHAAIFVANGLTNGLEDGVRLLAGVAKRDPEMIRGAADLVQSRIMFGKQSLKGMVMAAKAGHSIIDPRPVYHSIPGVAGEVVRTFGTRPISAMDEFWRVNSNLAYVRMRSLQLSRREGAARGLKGKQLEEFIGPRAEADVRVSLDPATGASRLPEARSFAAMPTFSAPLNPGDFGHSLEKLVQNHPLLTPILPFMRTSVNIFDYAFNKSSPLGVFSETTRKAIAAGGEEGAIAATRLAVGTTIWGTAGAMALGGMITGQGPADPALRKMWLKNHQPYSVKVGDSWVSYRRAEPFSTSLGFMADLTHIVRDNSDDLDVADGSSRVFYSIVAATASATTNKTYLSGLVNFMDAIGSNSPNDVKRFVDGLATSMIPNVVQVFNTDPLLRESKGMFDALVARVPGWSQSLPARYDVFGEPITLKPGRQQRALNPFPVKTPEPAVEDDILALDRAFTPPPTLERFGGVTVNLHNQKYANASGGNLTPYERWMEIVRENGLRDRVTALVNSDAYQRAGSGTDVAPGGRRYAELEDIIRTATSRAKRKMLSEYPDLAFELKALDRARRASMRSDEAGTSILERLQ